MQFLYGYVVQKNISPGGQGSCLTDHVGVIHMACVHQGGYRPPKCFVIRIVFCLFLFCFFRTR